MSNFPQFPHFPDFTCGLLKLWTHESISTALESHSPLSTLFSHHSVLFFPHSEINLLFHSITWSSAQSTAGFAVGVCITVQEIRLQNPHVFGQLGKLQPGQNSGRDISKPSCRSLDLPEWPYLSSVPKCLYKYPIWHSWFGCYFVFFFQNWIHLEVQINHIRSYFQHRALGTGQRDSKLSKTKLWKNKNTPKMSLLKGSLPFGFKMLSVTTLGNLSSTEINIIRKGLSMGGKTRKQKEMEVLEIHFPLETILFSSYFLIRHFMKFIALLSIFF